MHFAEVLVTEDAVFFDGQELPWYIAKDGIDFIWDEDGVHRLRVDFLVENVSFHPMSQWQINHNGAWYWLERRIGLETDMEHIAFDILERKYVAGH